MFFALVCSRKQPGMAMGTFIYVRTHTHRATLSWSGEASGRNCLTCRIEMAVLTPQASPVQSSVFTVDIMFLCSSAG